MEDKKDIGKALKEKLDGLQKSPGDAVWQSLNADLNKRRKRRLTSFWFRFVGIALLVLVTTSVIALTIWDDETPPPSAIQNAETGNTVSSSNNDQGTGTVTSSGNDDTTHANSKSSTGDNNKNAKNGYDANNKITGTDSNANISNKGADGNSGKNIIKQNTGKPAHAGNTVSGKNADNSNPATGNNSLVRAKRKVFKNPSAAQDNIAKDSQNSTAPQKKQRKRNAGTPPAKAISGQDKTSNSKLTPGSDQQASGNSISSSDKSSAVVSESNTTHSDGAAADKGTASGTDIITKAVGINNQLATNDTIKPADSLKTEKPITEEEKKPEEKKKTDSIHSPNFTRWYFAVNAGPSKYIFPSNKSVIDSRLDANAVDTKSSFNYGAWIGYRFNARWGVRLGINSTKFEQVTKNAYLLNDLQQPEGFDNIKYAPFEQTNPGDPGPVFSTGSNAAIVEKLGAYADITIKTSYIEIPAEITFHAFGNRVGADITGGMSALFINENTVDVGNSQGNMHMGSLDTKKMSFSTNLGLRVYYQLIPSLQFNIEPAFRYYLNTFNDVKPYSLNLQAGLQYNFNIGKKKE